MVHLLEVLQKLNKQLIGLCGIFYAAGLSDTVHAEHGGADIDSLDAGLGGDEPADGGAAGRVVLDYELLGGEGTQLGQDGGRNAVGSVVLVDVDLYAEALIDLDLVVLLVLQPVVGVHRVRHVGRDLERLRDRDVVPVGDLLSLFFGHHVVNAPKRRRQDHRIGALGRLGAHLLVVEKRDNVDPRRTN